MTIEELTADFITDRDVRVLEEIARRYTGRNIIGQSRQITCDADATLFTETLRRVASRVRQLGSWYPNGVPAPEAEATRDAS
jgi:hypothetical protein